MKEKLRGTRAAFLSLITVCQEADKYTQLRQTGPNWVESAAVAGEQRPLSAERDAVSPRSATLCRGVLLPSRSGVEVISCDMRKHALCLS